MLSLLDGSPERLALGPDVEFCFTAMSEVAAVFAAFVSTHASRMNWARPLAAVQ